MAITLAELPGLLMEIAARAGEAAIPAADAIGETYRDEVKRLLTERSHARGTITPSPPGSPPAMESGALAASVTMDPASTPVVATATIAPHLPPRDWVQEGGKSPINARPGGLMAFYYGGIRLVKTVHVPARPYMYPAIWIVAGNGTAADAAAAAFYAAMWG